MDDRLADSLTAKVEELISRYEALKSENASLNAELSALRAQSENNKTRIKNLETQLGNYQLKEALMGTSDDRAKSKRRVAGLIKEIDECISLLNG